FADGLSSQAIADYLRKQSPEDLFRAYLDPAGGRLLDFSGAFRDGILVPDGGIAEELADWAQREPTPLLIGSNRDEAKLGLMQDPAQVRRTLDVFLRVRNPDQYEVLSAIQTSLGRMRDVEGLADRIAAGGGGPVYVYRFDWDEEPFYLGADLELLLGAAHGVELPFVFGQFQFDRETAARLLFNEDNAPGRRFVSDSMMSYWAEFAYRGSPGRGRARALPLWTPWLNELTEKRFMVFDTPQGGGIRMSTERTDEQGIAAIWSESTAGWPAADRCEVLEKLLHSGSVVGLLEIDDPCAENLKTSDGGMSR
ncbi:carboxylesterase family protein, partial [Myxococcota bacterium]|nr:carboxylesterase family protein [Myxococcota bacterium]